MAPETKTTTTRGKHNPTIQFTNPPFSFHRSIAHHCLPLSKYCKLPSNQGKTIIARAAVILQHADAQNNGPPRVLLMHRKDGPAPGGSMWELPGDQVRLGTDQTVFETVARSVREQTGLVVTNIARHFGNVEWEREGRKYKGVHFLCTAKVVQAGGQGHEEKERQERQERQEEKERQEGQEEKEGQRGQGGEEGQAEPEGKDHSQGQDDTTPVLIHLDNGHDRFKWATAWDLLQLKVMTPIKGHGDERTPE